MHLFYSIRCSGFLYVYILIIGYHYLSRSSTMAPVMIIEVDYAIIQKAYP